ncbi:MAG: zf-HC2 domain-containing protein [Nitrospirae bacterium]|nr:zf-HC2 domain-containing protein [Nitrospirota bacterium]
MKECERVKKLLSRYLDEEITGIDAAFVKQHLDICNICNKEYLEFLKVKQLMLKKERKSLPEDYLISLLKEKITSRQYAEENISWLTGLSNLSRRLIPIPIAAIVLSVVFLIVVSGQKITAYSLDEHILSGSQTTTGMALGVILGTQN